jgi:hypothetical protein
MTQSGRASTFAGSSKRPVVVDASYLGMTGRAPSTIGGSFKIKENLGNDKLPSGRFEAPLSVGEGLGVRPCPTITVCELAPTATPGKLAH